MSRLASLAVLGFALATAALGASAAKPEAAAAAAKVPRYVLLRVDVDAAGKVQGARALNKDEIPALANAAIEISRKLTFTPARKDGRAVPSETSLMLELMLVPKPEGGAGVALQGAHNGPSVLRMGKPQPPKVRSNGGVVFVGADLRADGSVDMDSFKVDKVEMRTESSADQERFVVAAKHSLKDTVFQLDKVDGVEIASHISVPYQFNGGAEKRDRNSRGGLADDDEDYGAANGGEPKHKQPPSITAVSTVAGVDLPKIDYQK
jgi:TonB family protein